MTIFILMVYTARRSLQFHRERGAGATVLHKAPSLNLMGGKGKGGKRMRPDDKGGKSPLEKVGILFVCLVV